MTLRRILGVVILLTLGFLIFTSSSVMIGLIVLFVKMSPWYITSGGSVLCSLMLVIYWLEKK